MQNSIVIRLCGLVLAGALCGCGDAPLDPSPEAIRVRTIQSDIAAIDAQVESLGGWESWREKTEAFRIALNARVDEARASGHKSFLGKNNFVFVRSQLRYLLKDDLLLSGERDSSAEHSTPFESIVHLNSQLRCRGVDLIVVLVPTRGEMYPDYIVAGTDPQVPVAPHRTELVRALLESDVEAIDLWPQFSAIRDDGDSSLYLEAYSHWGHRAVEEAARELADRVARYPEIINQAKLEFSAVPVHAPPFNVLIRDLPPEIAEAYVTTPVPAQQVRDARGRPYAPDPDSPVLIIGDSYVGIFAALQADIAAHLARFLGTPVTSAFSAAGGPTVPTALARHGAAYIDRRRVIVWLFTARYLGASDQWRSVELPEPESAAH